MYTVAPGNHCWLIVRKDQSVFLTFQGTHKRAVTFCAVLNDCYIRQHDLIFKEEHHAQL